MVFYLLFYMFLDCDHFYTHITIIINFLVFIFFLCLLLACFIHSIAQKQNLCLIICKWYIDFYNSKVQLRLAVSRLRLQRNKKTNGVKNSKYEVAELLRKGNDESARIKVHFLILLILGTELINFKRLNQL